MTVLLRERKLDWLNVDIIHEYSTHGPNTITTVETVGQDCSLIYDMFVFANLYFSVLFVNL